jgi:PAS domain S-box-containing protein
MSTTEPAPETSFDPAIVNRVADAAPDGVVVVDRAGLIRYWNHGMTRIFGFDAADVLGGPLDVIIPERLRKRHNDGFDAAVASGTTRYGDDDLLAVPAVAKDGRSLSIEFSIVLLEGAAAAGEAGGGANGDAAGNSDGRANGEATGGTSGETSAGPNGETGGGIAYVAALIRDVTEHWHRDRDLKRRLRELEAAAGTGTAGSAGAPSGTGGEGMPPA